MGYQREPGSSLAPTPRGASPDPTTPRGASPNPTTPRGASPDPTTPPKARYLRLAALALATGIAGLLAAPAAASTAGPAPRQQPWIAITSVTPQYAQPNEKITVSGIVTNPGGSPLRGLSVQLWSSAVPLTSSAMASYLTAPEPTGVDYLIPGELRNLAPVPAHGAEQWAMTLTTSQVQMRTFGVYPLAAHLIGASPAPGFLGAPLDYARTFLPFWPGKPAAKSVPPVSIAWIWPLIDTPQQTVCGTLTSNELAANVASGGRLSSLLAAGQTATARQAMLTWAIDPALLSDVSVMSRRYRVTGTGGCSGGKQEPPSSAAGKWLAGVQDVAAHQDFFTTPYADVDVAALAHARVGLDPELTAAFTDGRLAAAQAKIPGTQTKILGQPQQPTPPAVGYIAWPAGGIADYGVLEALARNQIKTVILNSSLIHTPATVTTASNGQGGELTVLRASSLLTQILSIRRDQIPGLVPTGNATPPGARTLARQAAAFAKEQWLLADTAMVAAEAPAAGRSIVVAPPRHWNPLPGMASALLDETTDAPWLRPASLAGLASSVSPGGQPGRPPGRHVSSSELSASLLAQVGRLDARIRLLDSILTTPGRGYLSTAVDTVESSAWRGRKANERPAKQLVHSDLAYVLGRLEQVKIVGSPRVTLGGQNGVVPVSISNGLDQPVTVKLVASTPPADQVTIGKFTNVITVQGHTQRTIKIPVTKAQAGSTTLTLHLTTKDGKPLPVASSSLTVVATHFGTLAIVIISIALVVFVLTATARAIRRGGPQDDGSAAEAEELDPMPSTGDRASAGKEPDSVVSRGADDRQAAKEADEHASTPGPADRG